MSSPWKLNNDGKKIAGVCTGLAHQFDAPIIIMPLRIFFILTTIFYGLGIFLYILLWLLMSPPDVRPMALIKCEECGKEVSTKAKTCPHCGAPVKTNKGINTMKIVKWITIVFVILLGVVLYGYSKEIFQPSASVVLIRIILMFLFIYFCFKFIKKY